MHLRSPASSHPATIRHNGAGVDGKGHVGMALALIILNNPVDMALHTRLESHQLALVLPRSSLQELRRPLMTKATSSPILIAPHLAVMGHPVPRHFLLRPQLLTRL